MSTDIFPTDIRQAVAACTNKHNKELTYLLNICPHRYLRTHICAKLLNTDREWRKTQEYATAFAPQSQKMQDKISPAVWHGTYMTTGLLQWEFGSDKQQAIEQQSM